MVLSCCVGNCSKSIKKTSDRRHFLRFYRFPKDLPLQKQWIARINRRQQDVNVATMYVCSDHFADEDFKFSGYNRSKLTYTDRMHIPLKEDAVPNTNRETGEIFIYGSPDSNKGRKRIRRFGAGDMVDEIIAESELTLQPDADREQPAATAAPSSSTDTVQEEALSTSMSVPIPCSCATRKKHVGLQCNIANTILYNDTNVHQTTSATDCEFDNSTSSSEDDDLTQDPSYCPTNLHVSPNKQLSYTWLIVQLGRLDELIKFCPQCGYPITSTVKTVSGFSMAIRYTCSVGHNGVWQSSPMYHGRHLVNNTFSAAVAISGIGYSSIESLCNVFNMPKLSKSQFNTNNKVWLYPVIAEKYNEQQQKLLTELRKSSKLKIGGDGAFDSPGHSAVTCTYTIMDSETKKVIDFVVVRKGQYKGDLESQACAELIRILVEDYKLSIESFVTDQHLKIGKHMREFWPMIYHAFDIWHMARNLSIKLTAIGKLKDCAIVGEWRKSIINHFWWSCKKCAGDADLLLELFHSILFHVVGLHTWAGKRGKKYNQIMGLRKEGQRYPVFKLTKQCFHIRLTARQVRGTNYMDPDTIAFKKLFSVITDTRRSNALRKCSKFLHTGGLEVLHNVKLKYLPKSKAFSHTRSVIFMMLISIETNLSANLDEKKTYIQFSKRQNDYVLKSRYKKDSTTYKLEILDKVMNNIMSNDKIPLDISKYVLRPIPKTFHGVPKPSMEELKERQLRRTRL